MSVCAKITVTSGPDRGKTFELTGEMMRLGKAPDNELVFTDAQVGDHHASIVRREGRFAIYLSAPEGLEIDGTDIPPERWVWLPESAMMRVGKRTNIEFVVGENNNVPATANAASAAVAESRPAAPAASPEPPPRAAGSATGSAVPPTSRSGIVKGRRSVETARPGSDAPAKPRRAVAERGEKKSRTIARFITDGPGDPLVKLGEDGHLPELSLHETVAGERPETGTKQSNPVILLVAIGFSFGITLLMLFMDSGGFGDSAQLKQKARREITEYYGDEKEPLKPYQLHLRDARLAHSRGDRESERQEYRSVLALLRSEAKEKIYKYNGLTGQVSYEPSSDNKKSDKRLEELIGILLSE